MRNYLHSSNVAEGLESLLLETLFKLETVENGISALNSIFDIWLLLLFAQLVASLLGIEAGQDAVIRTEMYKVKDMKVAPYNYTVADFSNAISTLRNDLSHAFVDEGLVVPKYLGAEGNITGNILSGDKDSVSYPRTGEQVLETVYGTGDPSKPGGFYPKGAQGVIPASLLKK